MWPDALASSVLSCDIEMDLHVLLCVCWEAVLAAGCTGSTKILVTITRGTGPLAVDTDKKHCSRMVESEPTDENHQLKHLWRFANEILGASSS